MRERVLAGCSNGGNCPSVVALASGDVAVTGALPDGTEATVTVPAAVFDQAAQSWRRDRRSPWWCLAPKILGWAAVGLAVTYAARRLGASALIGHLAGLAVVFVACGVVGWREGGRDG